MRRTQNQAKFREQQAFPTRLDRSRFIEQDQIDGRTLRNHLRPLMGWLILVPLIIVLLVVSSELGLAFIDPLPEINLDSHLTAGYGPWEPYRVRALQDGILAEIRQDLQYQGLSPEKVEARLSNPIQSGGEFTIKVVQNPTTTSTPASDPGIDPETLTPTLTEAASGLMIETITPSPTYLRVSPTTTKTTTPTASCTASATTSMTATISATATITPTGTSSSTPKSTPPLCFESGGWYAMHYTQINGDLNYVGTEFTEGHGLPNGPMALNSVIIESVNLKQVDVGVVESIEKVRVGWRNGTIQDIAWSGGAGPSVTIPIGIDMPYVYPELGDNAYRATYVTFFLRGDIDGSYEMTITLFLPEYHHHCSMTVEYSTH